MDGNEGTLGIGELGTQLLSLRHGGTFLTESALRALPVARRRTGMVCLVLETGAEWFFDSNGVEGLAPVVGTGTWRPVRNAPMLYGKSYSFLAAALKSTNGFVTTRATKATADSISGAALNGALVDANHIGQPSKAGMSFWPIATSTSNAGSYVAGSVITFTGTYNGAAVVRTATVVGTGGAESLIGDGPMDTLTQVDIAAQVNTSGAWTIGFSGISPKLDAVGNYKKWFVKAYSDASAADTSTLHVAYADGSTDSVELAKGAQLESAPVRIYADSTADITIYE